MPPIKNSPPGPRRTVSMEVSARPSSQARESIAPRRAASTASQVSENYSPRSSRSTKKILAVLQRIPGNRSCADCGAPFVDPSSIWVSLSPHYQADHDDHQDDDGGGGGGGEQQVQPPTVGVSLHDFGLTHQAFAPPDVQKKRQRPKRKNGTTTKTTTKTTVATDPDKVRLGCGHGVFVCLKCSGAHRKLGSEITTVKAATELSHGEALWMEEIGGNVRCAMVLERYVPDPWKQRRPVSSSSSSSSYSDRYLWIRAKYEALAFVFPPPGPLAPTAWNAVLNHNVMGKAFASSEFRDIMSFSPGVQLREEAATGNRRTSGLKDHLPNRLVDYFCVVTSSMKVVPSSGSRRGKDLSESQSAEAISFIPHISDCYPERDTHGDMDFPEHLASFVMPLGCHPSFEPKPPTFLCQCLTSSDGEHLFCGCLTMYDESMDLQELKDDIKELVTESGSKRFAAFLQESTDDDDSLVYLPTCLVIVSHYSFYDLWRHFLLGIYQCSHLPSPIPLERYIANFVSEIPLPPHGRVRVQWNGIAIERPAPNQLPMANIPFRPLFASLSVSNIMVVLGHLLEETKVCVHSNNLSLLCPVTEALRSALFPFMWSGIYVPVLPLSMVEILDAPVPFLLGVHSDYIQLVNAAEQPKDVLFVDLDRDVLHMGELHIPDLPTRDATKLRNALGAAGGSAYLVPNSGIKGCIMAGKNSALLVRNENRPEWARMTTMTGLSASSLGRKEVFSASDLAYGANGISGFHGFGATSGWMSADDKVVVHPKRNKSLLLIKPPVKNFNKAKKTQEILASSDAAMAPLLSGQSHLLDIKDANKFSTEDIRKAFLRFTVSLFGDYEEFLIPAKDDIRFDVERFTNLEHGSSFLRNVCDTQMFQTFLREKKESQTYEVQFFDEQVKAKKNRSKRETLKSGGKRETQFLDDGSWKVTQTYTPPNPSRQGLPDTTQEYNYGQWPRLDRNLFGAVRPPTTWPQIRNRSATRLVKRRQAEMMKNAIKPIMAAPAAVLSAAGRTAKDIDSALFGIPSRREKKDSRDEEDTTVAPASGRQVKALSKVDTILINSRRKQMILLDVIVHFQARWRGVLVRIECDSLKQSAHVERQGRLEEETALLQSWFRTVLARKHANMKRAAIVKIQSLQRRRVAIRKWRRIQSSVFLIQTNVRSRRALFLFGELKRMVGKLQARVRGMQVRSRIRYITSSMKAAYTRQISTLWIYAHVPLFLRTKLWPDLTLGSFGFLRIRLAEKELHRLWKILCLDQHEEDAVRVGGVFKECELVGIDARTYGTCLYYAEKIDSASLAPKSGTFIATSIKVEETERLQIYERLNQSVSEKELSLIYQQFGIPAHEKLKKACLSQKIFSQYDDADRSIFTMRQLFPELIDSLGITFTAPTSKGFRRFPNASKTPVAPVDKNLWDEASVESNLKKHVREAALLYITKVPALLSRLDSAMKESAPTAPMSFRNAAVKSCGVQTWREARVCLIKTYLEARYSEEPHCVSTVASNDTSGNAMLGGPNGVQVEFPDVMATTEPGTTDFIHFRNVDMAPTTGSVAFPEIDLCEGGGGETHEDSNSNEAGAFPDIDF